MLEPFHGADPRGEQLQQPDNLAAGDHRNFQRGFAAHMVGAAQLGRIATIEVRLAALQRPAGIGVDGLGQRIVLGAGPCGRQHQPVARIVEHVERAGEAGHQFHRRRLQHGIGVGVVRSALQHIGHLEQPRHLLARLFRRLHCGSAAIGLGDR